MPRARRAAALTVLAAALAGCDAPVAGTPPASSEEAPQIREFTRLPVTPGMPGGIVVDGDVVYVDTFGFVIRPTDGADNLYAFDLHSGELLAERPNPTLIPRRFPVCTMGLSGIALDASGRLYLVDMNSRILRLDPRSGEVDDYASFPTGAAGPVPTMPSDIAFDAAGYAYVSDIGGAPVIWRVPPGGGTAEVWFTDPRLAGVWSMGGGGLRLDPAGQRLYIGVVASAVNQGHGAIYSLPIDNPSADEMLLFHQYPNLAEAPPLGAGPLGIAFGASGRLYVALPGTNQVSVLAPDGQEERRFSFEQSTQFVALTDNGTLLVTTWAFPDGPWPIYEVAVDDVPAGLMRPQISG